MSNILIVLNNSPWVSFVTGTVAIWWLSSSEKLQDKYSRMIIVEAFFASMIILELAFNALFEGYDALLTKSSSSSISVLVHIVLIGMGYVKVKKMWKQISFFKF